MLEELLRYGQGLSPGGLLRDAADVLITYYLIYRVVLVLRGTRAMQAGLGLGLLLLLYVASKYFQLSTVFVILGTVLPSAILIVVVVFQDDIRRGLMRVGSRAWSGTGRFQETRVIDEVIEAATELARHRTGAIIAFEQDANLDDFVGTHKGIDLDAIVSSQLLVSLFIPEAMNKLHDGAVVIRNLRIAKAGVFFPFKRGTRVVDESFGSRHRAALGITDETDAVLIVVSEERGSVSFCFNGNIVSNLDGPRLKAALNSVFSPVAKSPSGSKSRFLSSLMPKSLRAPSGTKPSGGTSGAKPAPARTTNTMRLVASKPPASGGSAPAAEPLRKSPVTAPKQETESTGEPPGGQPLTAPKKTS